MLSPKSFQGIKEKIYRNEEKINLIQSINIILRERHEIETNYKNLCLKFTKMQREETEKREKHDLTRKAQLLELETKGAELCKEHAKMLTQIEHLEWHVEGCSEKHKDCHQSLLSIEQPQQNNSTSKKLSTITSTSCQSSATSCTARPSLMANLKNSADRLIKGIVDLRKRTYIIQEKLDHEIKRKKDMEKKLSDLRKEISRQKKSLSLRRATPLPSLPPIKKSGITAK